MKKNKVKKIIFTLVLVIIVIIIFGKSCGFIGGKGVIEVAIDKVERRDIIETVSASGKIKPEKQIKISSEIPGEIIELYVKEGDEVKEGDILCKINPEIYLSTIDRLEASVNTAKANLANAKARLSQVKAQFIATKLNYDRNEKLWKEKVISDAEFESIKSQYEVSKAEVEAAEQNVIAAEYNVKSAEASLAEAMKNLTKTTIYAPMSGIVSKLNVEKGEKVVGTSQFAGTEIMTISDLSDMEVSIDVSENDITRIKIGDTALIDIDAYPEHIFKGIVSDIAITANTTNTLSNIDQVTNFTVKIKILKNSYQNLFINKPANYFPLRPGMSASVNIQTAFAKNVFSIPIQCITTRIDSTETFSNQSNSNSNNENAQSMKLKEKSKIKEFVFVHENGKVYKRYVKTGIQDNQYIEIKEGLRENEEVVSAPYRAISKYLKNGDKVIVLDKKDLFEKLKKNENQ